MGPQNQNTTITPPDGNESQLPPSLAVAPEPVDPEALSSDPSGAVQPDIVAVGARAATFRRLLRLFLQWGALVAAVFILIGGGVWLVWNGRREAARLTATNPAASFATQTVPLESIAADVPQQASTARQVIVNGQLQIGNGMVLTPSLQPSAPQPGQLYYDQNTNLLGYFNGTEFIFLDTTDTAVQPVVEQIAGLTGQIGLGPGLAVAGGSLMNGGVLSISGSTGAITLGGGLSIVGNALQNTGVLNVVAGSGISVTSDGSGTYTVANIGAGSGTVASSGGTVGRIPVFTGVQNIEDSLLSQSGTTVTVNGDLNLTNALTVSNGGTGAASLAANGVLVGNGTGPVTAVTAGGPNLCLLSTVGAPVFAACPGAGVTSLNGLNGALNVANASAAGSTITIDSASTSAKGIAQFNNNNFNDNGAGLINTIQDIHTGATPTFAGLNTNSITPSGALTVGAAGQTALLQGSTTTITSNSGDIVLTSSNQIRLTGFNCSVFANGGTLTTDALGNLVCANDDGGAGGVTSVNALVGDLILQGTAGQIAVNDNGSDTLTLSLGANVTLQGNTFNGPNQLVQLNGSGQLPAVSGALLTNLNGSSITSGTIANARLVNGGELTVAAGTNLTGGGNVALGGSVTLHVTDDPIFAGNVVVEGGSATLGTIAQAGGLVIHDGNGQTTTLQAGNSTGNLTFILPTSAGSAAQCLKQGGGNQLVWDDCEGGAGGLSGVTSLNSLNGTLSIQGTANRVTISDNGSNTITVSTPQDIHTAASPIFAGLTLTGSLAVEGGTATIGTTSQAGSLVVHDGNGQTTTLQAGDSSGDLTFVLPTSAGTSLQCLKKGTGNQLIWDDCEGGSGGSSGVASVNALTGDLILQGTAGQIAVNDNGSDTLTLSLGTDVTLQGNTFNGANQLVQLNGSGQLPAVSGALLTNLNGSAITTGTIANARLVNGGELTVTAGTNLTGGGDVALGGTVTLNVTDNPTFAGNIVVQGGSATIGTTSQTASLVLHDGNGQTTTLQAGNSTGNLTFILPTSVGNIAQCLKQGGSNQLIWDDCEGGTGGISGVTSVNALAGDLVLQGAVGQITVNDNGSDTITLSLNAAVTLQGNTFNGPNQLVQLNGSGELPVLSGINLTDLNASELTTGTVPSGVISGLYTGITGVGTISVGTWQGTTIDIGFGGTGATTQQGAINNLSGLTTQGDLLYHNGTNVVRLPRGSNGDCLVSTATTIQWGSCLGGGAITGSGTPGTIAVFTDTDEIGDSLLSQGAGAVTVDGHLNLTAGNQFRINGVQISSADLSNDSNLAKLDATQTFTGNTNSFRNGADSANAFNVQNAAGVRVLTVNTTAGQLELGAGSSLNGSLVFNNANNNNAVTILSGTLTGNRTILLPDSDGTICLTSGNCAGVGGMGDVLQGGNSFGATMTIGTNDNNDLVLERNNAVRLTIGANDLTLASGIDLLLQGANAFISNPQGQSNSESFGLNAVVGGANSLAVGAGASTDAGGDSTAVGSGAIAGATGTSLGYNASSQGNSVALGAGATANSSGIAIGAGANNDTFDGSIALGYEALNTADNQLVVGSDTASIQQVVIGNGVTNATPVGFMLQGTSGSGTNVAGASVTIAGGQGTGTGAGGDIAFQIAAPGASGSSLNSLTTVLQLSGTDGSVTIQNAADSAVAFRILDQAGTSIAVGVDHVTDLVWSDYNVTINAALDAVDAIIHNTFSVEGTSNLYGDVTVGDDVDSTTAFRVLDGDSEVVMQIDTTNHYVYIGNPVADSTGALLVLDTKNTSGDPSGVDGSMYYNSSLGKFRCFQAGVWADCLGGGLYSDSMPTRVGTLQSFSPNTTAPATIDVSSVPNGNWMLLAVAFGTANASPTTPAGWTTVVNQADYSATRKLVVMGKIKEPGDGVVSISKGTTVSYASIGLVHGAGGSHPSQWQVGNLWTRGGLTMNQFITVAPSVTTQIDNSLALALSFEATTAAESSPPVTTGTGWAGNNWLYVADNGTNTNIDQIRIAYKEMPTAGATGDATDTYINAQVNNGAGIQVIITPSVGYFVGTTDVTDGQAGLVPAPLAGQHGSVLLGDGSWSEGVTFIDGQATFQNANDSTAAFQVLNDTSVPLFVIDTSNSRVYIGNPTADSTGALLVLDTKNTGGDPGGVDGAMYYNSAMGVMRCYELNMWYDCGGVSRPNSRRSAYMVSDGTMTFSGYGTSVTNSGTVSFGAGNDIDAFVSYATGAVSGDNAGFSTAPMHHASSNPLFQTSASIPTTTNVRVWYVLTDEDLATIGGSATPSGDYIGFRFDTGAGDTTYQCVASNNGSRTIADSGVTVTTNEDQLEVSLIAGTRAVFKINGVVVCNITTNLPDATQMWSVHSVTTLTSDTRSIRVHWFYIENDPS